VPSYNKNTQIFKQQSIQEKKTWISPKMAITTIAKKLQVALNKQLQKNIKMDNNLLFPTCYNFLFKNNNLQ